jgi:hypothetical protein
MNPSARSELSVTGTFHKSQWNAIRGDPLCAPCRTGRWIGSDRGRSFRGRANDAQHRPRSTTTTTRRQAGRFFANAYAQYYRFDLFTNFTFFQNDPVNGDGFQQSDRRIMYGGDIGYKQNRTMVRHGRRRHRWACKPGSITSMRGSGRKCVRNPLGSDERIRIFYRSLLRPLLQTGNATGTMDAPGRRRTERGVYLRCAQSLFRPA